ncbi:MAG: radical SAM protein [Phycisphaerales bacterium]|nr:MAG: radical SAM protein [Phycisphaerales bacterium]
MDVNATAGNALLERLEQARRQLRCCNLCPRRCGVDRTAGQAGYCRLDDSVRCFREMLHFAEERGLSPSHQIYFAGCNLRCEFCTVAEWNEQPQAAEPMDPAELAEKIEKRRRQGARTVNFLGGEPTLSVHGIIQLAACIDSSEQVVLNSNMYYNRIVDDLLVGLVDIYLADLKCGNAECAEMLLGAADYVDVAGENIKRAAAGARVIVRHLVLPGHQKCCLEPTLKWLAQELPQAEVSIRGDYVPPAAPASAPADYLTAAGMDAAVDLAAQMGLNLIQ